jgi:hypothetical protein
MPKSKPAPKPKPAPIGPSANPKAKPAVASIGDASAHPVPRSLIAHREHPPVPGPRAHRAFVLTKLGREKLSPERIARSAQIRLIVEAIGKLGKAASVASVASAIREKLETVQTAERVVGFYASTWRKAGYIE